VHNFLNTVEVPNSYKYAVKLSKVETLKRHLENWCWKSGECGI